MGKINVYTCDKGHKTVTIQKVVGATPMFILCREKDCQKQALGQMYIVNQNQEPGWEWYKPNKEEAKAEMKALLDSGQCTKKQYQQACLVLQGKIKSGELLLRKI